MESAVLDSSQTHLLQHSNTEDSKVLLSLNRDALNKSALIQLPHDTAVGEVFRFCSFGFRVCLLQSLQQTCNPQHRRIRRDHEIALDDHVVAFLKQLAIVRTKRSSHRSERKGFIFLSARRPFDVSP